MKTIEFNKSELKYGMWAECKNHEMMFFFTDPMFDEAAFMQIDQNIPFTDFKQIGRIIPISNYDDALNHKLEHELDIVKVLKSDSTDTFDFKHIRCIWERPFK